MERKTVLKQLAFYGVLLLYVMFLGISAYGEKKSVLQKGIAKEVFRFHVLANSDSREDQTVKLKVKDGMVKKLNILLQDCKTAAESEWRVTRNLDRISRWAEEELKKAGGTGPVSVETGISWFPEKTYGDCTFPEGNYRALRVKIGNAEGKNWWCLLFPGLCFAGTMEGKVPPEQKEKLRLVLTAEEYDAVVKKEGLCFGFKWFS